MPRKNILLTLFPALGDSLGADDFAYLDEPQTGDTIGQSALSDSEIESSDDIHRGASAIQKYFPQTQMPQAATQPQAESAEAPTYNQPSKLSLLANPAYRSTIEQPADLLHQQSNEPLQKYIDEPIPQTLPPELSADTGVLSRLAQYSPSGSGAGIGESQIASPDGEIAPRLLTNLQVKEKRLRDLVNWKPANADKGWKGALMEGIQNFLFGLAEARRLNPRAGVKETLLGGGMATGLGFVDRTWNDRRNNQRQRGEAAQDYQMELGLEQNRSKLANEETARNAKLLEANADQTRADADKLKQIRERMNDQQKTILDVWKDLDEFDPNAPANKQFMDEAARSGLILLGKQKGDRFHFQVAPDGRIIIGNTGTGEYKTGEGNFARPTPINNSDLPDELFGLRTEKDITDAATASVGQLPTNRRVRPEVAGALDAAYKNPDGTVNEPALFQAINEGTVDMRLSDVYENLPTNYEQNLAATRKKMRDQQTALRTEVAKFRSALGTYKPNAEAAPVSLTKIVDLFNKIMALPEKERSAKLKKFYENLPNIKIS